MPALVVVAALVTLVFFAFIILTVTVPAMLYIGSAAALAGVIVCLGRSLTILLSMADVPSGLHPHELFHAGQVAPGVTPRDYAWQSYFAGQALHDLQHAVRLTVQDSVRPWTLVWNAAPVIRLREGDGSQDGTRAWVLLALLPVTILVAGVLAAFTVGAMVAAVAIGLIVYLVIGLACFAGWITAGLQRWIETVQSRIRRYPATCTRCCHVTNLPFYACPGRHGSDEPAGSQWHRHLRPGTQGVWSRRCGCGARMPASVLRAARVLRAVCPRCRADLYPGAGRTADVRIAVFGAPLAGKTELVNATVATLRSRASVTELDVTEPFPTVGSPLSVVRLHLKGSGRPRVAHLFDPPGAVTIDPDADNAYFDRADGYLFALDVTALPHPARALGTEATHDPEDSYQSVVTRLRRSGVDIRARTLAFAITKIDRISQLPEADSLARGSVEAFLAAQGLSNLTRAAKRDFGRVRYFRCGNDPETSASAPLLWLLTHEKALPARMSRVTNAI